MNSRIASLVLAVVSLAGAAALAQPLPSTAQTPAWRSALQDYRPFSDEPTVPWRASNDTVRAIGGWRAYAQEAQQVSGPGADESSSPSAAPSGSRGTPATDPAPPSQHKH